MSAPVPPSFKDLGKAANDLLTKDYPRTHSLEVKTKAPNNVFFKATAVDHGKGHLDGDIEAKFAIPKNGISITNNWSTRNIFKTSVEIENQVAKGLKLEGWTAIHPGAEGKASYVGGDVTATYKQPALHTRVGLAGAGTNKNVFNVDAVVGRDGLLFGGAAAYNVKSGEFSHWNVALGYSAPEYQLTLHGLNGLSTYSASYFHRVNRDVEAGAKAIYNAKSGSNDVALEIGGKAYLDNAAFVKGKINNAGVLGLGYTTALRPGLKASFGLAVDTKKLNAEGGAGSPHQVGWTIVFDG